ncbi:MAG: 1-acyl-sn-glycerol-3-phosphate acyltransferase [Proteobacteria bacterium]|nr:1-acyl-sn-glycerol-3-phosphate acyltransferase [Pseudomonadota bacterium]
MEDIWRLKYQEGSYKTGTKEKSLQPSLKFYIELTGIILNASKKAKRGYYDYDEWIKDNIRVIRKLEDVGLEFDITGIDNLGLLEGKPAVIIGNHMSTLETFTLGGILYPYLKVTFVVKESLVKMPVFKHIMISRKPIAVTRANPREDLKKVLEEGEKRLLDGYSVIIFPQTTRCYEFDSREFNSIGVKLAKRADVPIIPLALKTDGWSQGKVIKDFGKIDTSKKAYFIFGKPIFIEGNGQKEHREVVNFIADNLKKLGVTVK